MKKFTTLFLAFMLLLTITACFPDNYAHVNDSVDPNKPAPKTLEEAYSLYNKVDRGMTRDDVEKMFGEGEPSYDEGGEVSHITYFNETQSAGVSIIYEYDNSVKAKTLFFNTKRNLVPFSGRFDKNKIPSIKSDMSVSEASKVMGSVPLELSCAYGEDGPHDFKKIYCWYNEDASSFMLHTERDIIANVALYKEEKK
ncbi:MAG: hypothetical protein IJO09_07385 [Oscillospiraceae bacterium]|nr:hypothetical protein [Oscillospiraceae bacterium]